MQLKVGDRAVLSKAITHEDIADFARITLDTNPLHLDEEYAKRTHFGGTIAHGMLGASLISAVIGTKLGGPIYLGQTQVPQAGEDRRHAHRHGRSDCRAPRQEHRNAQDNCQQSRWYASHYRRGYRSALVEPVSI
jgi:hypothetical protein